MKNKIDNSQHGSGLVVVISVVATLLILLGAALSFTGQRSRLSQRTRKTALAMEIADGHLEYLFTNWRNIYRKTWTTTSSGGSDDVVLATNYFFTSCPTCSPAPVSSPTPTPVPNMNPSATPPVIPLPANSNFPTEPNYTVTQYRIQAIDPMINLDANQNAQKEITWGSETFTALDPSTIPPAAYGPDLMDTTTHKKKTITNQGQHSYFYLAAVDVTVPALTGNVTAKVRRVFEKKFDLPWTYAMLYVDDLEFQPTTSLTINGPIQTNGSLYIVSSNFTTTDEVGYGSDYVNGFSPNDTYHSGSVTAPNFPAGEPPSQTSPFLPFGWNLATGESYHDLIERPPAGGDPSSDPMSSIRYYNQADYRVLINSSNTVTITDYSGNSPTGAEDTAIRGAIATNQVIWDSRENAYIRVTTIDVSQVDISKLAAWNHTGTGGGIIYVSDTSAGTSVSTTYNGNSVSTTKRAIRLKNAATLPSNMTVVAENPVYIQGNYNTGGNPPSNSGTYTSPTVSGYTRKDSAVVADSINILSGAWADTNSDKSISSRVATSTTVNAALVTGEVPSSGGSYSGGGENFVRFLEDWQKNSQNFTYYGSMVELFNSEQGTGAWSASANVCKMPGLHWYYDTGYQDSSPP